MNIDSSLVTAQNRKRFYVFNWSVNLPAERVLWLLKEYEEPKIDWSKMSVDTKILDFYIENNWVQRYFAKYENGIVYAWNFGRTSWSAEDKYDYYPVKNAKLVEED